MRPRLVLTLVVTLAGVSFAGSGLAMRAATPGKFKNCTALNKRYPHGVGKVGARDKTSGEPVTNFKRSNRLYQLNKSSDRDKDGIACEKR